ncbi:MAG TPA: prolyl oligopeptidase family serine peptidase [Candidatus Saccharimonadales bacterium]|nr:prolyl oligopeptidase family serine peptidase [Candidatus Saccharimonadales bacterium]
MTAVGKTYVHDYFFKATNKPNDELVCYVSAYGAKVSKFNLAITTLQKLGYDVIAFDYDSAVLTAGNPQILLDIIKDVTDHLQKKSNNYKQTICMGASLGAFIAYSAQKSVDNAFIGAYAAAGVDPMNAFFSARSFKKIATAFLSNGYDKIKLGKAWSSLDVDPSRANFSFPANKSFIAFDGTTDRIVKYKEAKQNVAYWTSRGIHVKLFPVVGRGHLLTVIYFVRNTRRIVAKAKQHHRSVMI